MKVYEFVSTLLYSLSFLHQAFGISVGNNKKRFSFSSAKNVYFAHSGITEAESAPSLDLSYDKDVTSLLHPSSDKDEANLLDPWCEFEELRNTNFDDDSLSPFFRKRPNLILKRMYDVALTLYMLRLDWQTSHILNDKQSNDNDGSPSSIMDKNELSHYEVVRASNLCKAVSSLGPFSVKIGQTLSQRPDLVGADAAKALKQLQTKNVPFDNQLAFAVMHESLDYWDGPLAPGMEYEDNRVDPNGPTYFATMTYDPVASASLGQVYKARQHDGREVAVKVQRPDALAVLAQDAQCFRTVFKGKEIVEKINGIISKLSISSKNDSLDDTTFTEAEVRDGDQTVASVINRVAFDIKKELDYRIEAENSVKFKDSLSFLGFVTTPTIIQATDRVLITEWIPGRHLEDLSKEEGLAMTRMAVEACTASIVLTGFVHADPHEGNLMLHDDGRVVFLDFGLMSNVDVAVMEGFARGIQGLLSEQWSALTEAFVDIGFVNNPIMHRNSLNEKWRSDPKFGLPELTDELAVAMQSTEGGVSRFGALATVLNKEISPRWLVFTPPYVLLLIRTFLTLEGIAATVDPDFNIYEMSMPWAVRRSLSPSTTKGIDVFRATLLTEDNKIQWQRLIDMTNINSKNDIELSQVNLSNEKQSTSSIDRNEAMKNALNSLLGTTDGKALRQALNDLDSADLLMKLASNDGRVILDKIVMLFVLRLRNRKSKQEEICDNRPMSPEFTRKKLQTSRRRDRALRFLVKTHVVRCLLKWRGLKATVVFLKTFLKVFLRACITKDPSKKRVKVV